MMINRRLIGISKKSRKYIGAHVLFQWCGLIANIVMIFSIAVFLQKLAEQKADAQTMLFTSAMILTALIIRFFCAVGSSRMSYHASNRVKGQLREMIMQKLLRLGAAYHTQVKTSEVVQVTTEGIDQLESYFGAYLPQLFYSLAAPLTLFCVLSFVSLPGAAVLFICVPLIPVSIAAVQTFAKKLLSKYWGQYTKLGDSFLENLQGLTTLKIYQADEYKNQEMNQEAEKFRKITMKVLTMQLNSVTVMDLIAYGGSALGIILSVTGLSAGAVSLAGCIALLLLSADFFIPMRLLGSYFHIAMNGMAASEKIFRLLDLPVPPQRAVSEFPDSCDILCSRLRFRYEEDREILHGLSFQIPAGSFTAIVGESGCGKSTVASLLMGRLQDYEGSVLIGGLPLNTIREDSLMRSITYVSHASYLFKGSVRENLLMGNARAKEEALWEVLKKANLAAFLQSEQGLETQLSERAENLSGGQRQRLALARALLHDSPIYIFDEATSNIDAESENDIMRQIALLSKTKTVILITHRLANAVEADQIIVLKDGFIAESGSHTALLSKNGEYSSLWNRQSELERYTAEVVA